MIVRKRLDPSLKWFPEARFGMFIHFGLYALLQRGEWVMYNENIPRREHEKLARRFNPRRFDANKWVAVAQEAGARYICVTAKHHDGFCLFDSALTDFKVTNTPFKRDLIAELAAACRKAGLRILFYYSQPDWHHPNYVHRKGAFKDLDHPPETDQPDWPKYQEYLEGQVLELVTNYGRIDGIWFDGSHKTEQEWRGKRLYRIIKRHQPHAVVNDRARYGDFFTPERRICDHLSGYAFEVCDSVSPTSWGYQGDTASYSVPHLVGELARTASLGGNTLLNVGPKPDGTITPCQAERMRAIGAWLAVNGESIYGTQGCRLAWPAETLDQNAGDRKNSAIGFTRKGRTLYVHLREWPATDRLILPPVQSKPTRACLLGLKAGLKVSLSEQGCEITGLPMQPPVLPISVMALEFTKKPALRTLRPARPATVTVPLSATRRTVLPADAASLHGLSVKGRRLRLLRCANGAMSVADWFSPEHRAVWSVSATKSGCFSVTAHIACNADAAGALFEVAVAGTVLQARARSAGQSGVPHQLLKPRPHRLGTVRLPRGRHRLVLRVPEPRLGYLFGCVERIVLRPIRRR